MLVKGNTQQSRIYATETVWKNEHSNFGSSRTVASSESIRPRSFSPFCNGRRGHVIAHDASFVCRQTVQNQPHGPLTTVHQLAQQFDEQFAVQAHGIGAKPDFPRALTAPR